MFLTEDEVLMVYKDTDENISARSLTLLIFAVERASCGRPQPEHGFLRHTVLFCKQLSAQVGSQPPDKKPHSSIFCCCRTERGEEFFEYWH